MKWLLLTKALDEHAPGTILVRPDQVMCFSSMEGKTEITFIQHDSGTFVVTETIDEIAEMLGHV